jgi:hypothetical protein
MAIVKANFVKRDKSAKGRAKASIRYIQHRRGKDGEAITRTLFGSDGEMTRADAYRMIDEAGKGSLFYRFVLSPDPKAEDTGRDLDMRDITIQTLQALEERVKKSVLWVAAVHADHAPHRHIHVVAIVPQRLTVRDFTFLRHRTTEVSRQQRRFLDLGQHQKRDRLYPVPFFAKTRPVARTWDTSSKSWASQQGGSVGPNPSIHTCACPRCSTTRVHSIRDPVHRCDGCGMLLHKPPELVLARREAGWGR